MNRNDMMKLFGFYQNELKSQILPFWLKRCVDREHGGFINCFDNRGERLCSYDKYTWSQGRFVWMFARLASTPAPVFSREEREQYLTLAGHGADFLMKHCLMGADDWRCVFLMERDGTPKPLEPGAPLDMSIYADCFVIAGMAMYAYASGDRAAYDFARRLYESGIDRVQRNSFHTLPYPLSDRFRAHGIPMIFSNVTRELIRAAQKLDTDYVPILLANLEGFAEDILTHFVDDDDVMHEVIRRDNTFFPQILGQHMNPGHTIEDAWFLFDAADLCGRPEWEAKIERIALQALKNGWDDAFGGILHFTGIHGGEPVGDTAGIEDETMTRQLSGWNDKLWWIHSEALYTTLLCYFRSGNEVFLDWHERVFDYVFRTFPNPDPEIREWIQIRMQNGQPQEKVVALPVKDPYHISRNLILIIELLARELEALEKP